MPKGGSSAEKQAARRVQSTARISYADALRLLRKRKNRGGNWTQAADAVLAELLGPSLFTTGED